MHEFLIEIFKSLLILERKWHLSGFAYIAFFMETFEQLESCIFYITYYSLRALTASLNIVVNVISCNFLFVISKIKKTKDLVLWLESFLISILRNGKYLRIPILHDKFWIWMNQIRSVNNFQKNFLKLVLSLLFMITYIYNF